jgi:hypothetical protein
MLQGLVSDATRHPLRLQQLPPTDTTAQRFRHAIHDSIMLTDYACMERNLASLFGTRAPQRRRRKRLAKKLAARGGMLRCRGVIQSWLYAWPEMRRYV